MNYSRQLPVWLLAISASVVVLSLAQQVPLVQQQQQQQQPNAGPTQAPQLSSSTQRPQPQQQPELTARQLEKARLRQQASMQLDGNLEEIHHGHQANGDAKPAANNKDLWPMVHVDRHENKSQVDVHVPVFFDMTNHNDLQAGKAKLDLSVLQGLVTVTKDKSRDPDGQMNGPVKVTVFGIPVYTSHGNVPAKPSSVASSRRGDSNQTASGSGGSGSGSGGVGGLLAPLESRLEARVDSITQRLRDNFERTNEKVMRSLSDIMDRLSTMVGRDRSARREPTLDRANGAQTNNTRYNTIDTTSDGTQAVKAKV